MEKVLRNEIILEADEYKHAFHEKRKLNCETNKVNNREKEKVNVCRCVNSAFIATSQDCTSFMVSSISSK